MTTDEDFNERKSEARKSRWIYFICLKFIVYIKRVILYKIVAK